MVPRRPVKTAEELVFLRELYGHYYFFVDWYPMIVLEASNTKSFRNTVFYKNAGLIKTDFFVGRYRHKSFFIP